MYSRDTLKGLTSSTSFIAASNLASALCLMRDLNEDSSSLNASMYCLSASFTLYVPIGKNDNKATFEIICKDEYHILLKHNIYDSGPTWRRRRAHRTAGLFQEFLLVPE